MSDSLDIYSFVYRGVLAAEAIRRVAPQIDDSSPEQDIQRRMPTDSIEDSFVASARKMAPVYVAIAAFENSVRAFIEERLIEKVGAEWWTVAVSSGIRDQAEKRRKDEEQIRWHGNRGSSMLAYVQLEDLSLIIQNNHDHFKDLIPTVEWAREIFKSLARSRNVIMHSGQLTLADVERVGMNVRDWVRQMGG